MKDKWTEWNVSIPKNDYSSISLTNDQRYMIIFCGFVQRASKIFIYSLEESKLMKSKIIPPSYIFYSASIAIRNKLSEEFLVFGYVNQLFKLSNFKNVQKLPIYLIKFITNWISMECIHYINSRELKHWKISIDAILENTE